MSLINSRYHNYFLKEMFIDYVHLILTEYERLRFENKLPFALVNPTPSRLKEECLRVSHSRYLHKDERILEDFFGSIDGKESCLRTISRCNTDRFKPLVNYLNRGVTNTNPINIELLAWLIDFKERPFQLGKHYAELNSKTSANLTEPTVNTIQEADKNAYNPKEAHSIIKPASFYESIECFLRSIQAGKKDSDTFHKFSLKCLTEIFGNRLSNPKSEEKINEGRKRIDIVFDNNDTTGFFHKLNHFHHVQCPKIFFECKNYGREVGNPEIDQLLGRLGNKRGNFGILVCRSIDDRPLVIKRCRDVLNDKDAYLIVLDDNDIKHLLELKSKKDERLIDRFLLSKIDELIM